MPLLSLFIILLMFNCVYAQDELRDKDVSQPPRSIESPTDAGPGGSKETQESFGSQEVPNSNASPSKSDYTFIPLPAFAYNRNEGYWVGGLVAILKTNPKGEIADILAPQYLYNRYIGHSPSLSYYGYPSDTMQYHAIASYSEKIERTFELAYKDLGAGGGRYVLGVEATWFKNPFARFFGFGIATPESQETNYTSREGLGKLTVGINVTPVFVIMVTERYHDVRVEDGAVQSLPFTKQQFPTIPGIDGAQILGHGLTFRYDTRDSQLMPLQGTYVHLFGEFNQNVKVHDRNRWWRVTVDARHLVPHASNRMVFVSRVFFDGVIGQDENKTLETAIEGVDADGNPVVVGTMSQIIRRGVPFYERPTLGGENTLRGFGRNRFISNLAVLVNLEERISVAKRRVFDHDIEFELAPFLDAGRVGRTNFTAERLFLTNIQLNPGLGLRLLARPYIVGRLDIGYGRDGANVFVGLDYPF